MKSFCLSHHALCCGLLGMTSAEGTTTLVLLLLEHSSTVCYNRRGSFEKICTCAQAWDFFTLCGGCLYNRETERRDRASLSEKEGEMGGSL